MGQKKTRLIVTMLAAFVLSYFVQNNVFTVNGEEIRPEVLVAFENLPLAMSNITHSIKFERAPTPTPSAIPLLPTDMPVSAPTVVVPTLTVPTLAVPSTALVPTEIIYPTQIPIEEEPTVIVIPTATRVPTQIPKPTTIPTTPPAATLSMEDFGRCLNQNGMVMYSQPGCSACTQQKQLLGAAYSQITDISCPSKPEECSKVGVRTTPSWAKNGVMAIPGGTSLEYLAQIAGCQLPN